MELKIFLTNLSKYNEGHLVGKWVDVLNHKDWKDELAEIGVEDGTEYEECFITDIDSDLDGIGEVIGEYTSLSEVDEIAEGLEAIADYEEDAFRAAIEVWDFKQALRIIADGDYQFYPEVTSEESLGEYVVAEGIFGIEIPDSLRNYIDYEAIGRDWSIEADGGFASNGFIQAY